MERILLPLDGSRLSEAVVPLAEALARDYEAELLLVRAVDLEGSPDIETAAQVAAREYLTGVAASLAARGLAGVRWRVWFGEADQVIANAAVQEGATLVTMSTHGRSGLDRLRFGSIAESVVRKTPVPVVLIRGEVTWRPGALGRILVPLDGSGRSEAVLPVVTRLAGPFDLVVDLLHAVEPPPVVSLAEAPAALGEDTGLRTTEAEAYLRRVAEPLEARGLRVSRVVEAGPALEAVCRRSTETGAGLIAMSTHGRTGLGRVFLGSVAESILRAVSVPVLLWKA